MTDFSALLRSGLDAVGAHNGDKEAAERLAKSAIPALATLALGPAGGAIAGMGLELLERRRALVQSSDAIDVDYAERYCEVCGPEFKPLGERKLIRELREMDFGLIYVVGREGTGKSVTTFRLGELWGRDTFVIGAPQRNLPPGWQELRIPPGLLRSERPKPRQEFDEEDEDLIEDSDIETPLQRWFRRRVGQRATILIDDATLILDSATSGSTANRVVRDLIAIMRHLELNLCVNTQVTAAVTKYALNARALLLKPPVRRWEAQERELMCSILKDGVADWWERLPQRYWTTHVWADSETYSGPLHINLPSFWTTAMSRNKAV